MAWTPPPRPKTAVLYDQYMQAVEVTIIDPLDHVEHRSYPKPTKDDHGATRRDVEDELKEMGFRKVYESLRSSGTHQFWMTNE